MRRASEGSDEDNVDEPTDVKRARREVRLVGFNICGCDEPGENCSLRAFASASEALEHFKQVHAQKYESLYPCAWWRCEWRGRKLSDLLRHYTESHLQAKYACLQCGAKFLKRHQAEGCRHLKQRVEITAQYRHCGIRGCVEASREMEPEELRDHVLEHLHGKEAPFACPWRECEKQFKYLTGLQRHLLRSHLVVQNRCMTCKKLHETYEGARACCRDDDDDAVEPVLWTDGVVCRWDGCSTEFAKGDGRMLREHMREHLEKGEDKGVCKWPDCKAFTKPTTKFSLQCHVEGVHGKLRFKCAVCGKFRNIRDKKSAMNCSHEKKN